MIWRFIVTVYIFLKYALIKLADMLMVRRIGFLLTGRNYFPLTTPVLMRKAFEDLGPTYIKLAQIIASSEGLFPKAYSEEFRKCLDRVPPFSFHEVERILQEEFGRPFKQVYRTFEVKPIAAASIAQVHFATLSSGEEVVVKIQRPHIEERVVNDMKIMGLIARIIQAVVPHAELANPVGVVEDFRSTIVQELDFRLEGRNMDQFNEIMKLADNSSVVAPLVYWDYTTKRVLTMERFKGWRVDDYEGILASPYNSEEKLVAGLRGWFQCIILHGFFHGDVHAGNLMLLHDGRIGFLDFGIIGRFDEQKKVMVMEYIMAFQRGNFSKLAQVLVDMGSVSQKVDVEQMAKDLEGCYGPWLTTSFSNLKIGEVLPDVMRVSVKHRMRLPNEFVLITKQLLYFDKYAKNLAPKLNIFNDARLVNFMLADFQMAQKLKGSQARGTA
ncbi:MAG: AarF/ABC1/UbiB kinase family protein [Deltaproteobacteria bacterium]|nr:AarF/ABC1/UbiB kinase family protein [Deltaproteobacteria bacterium]